MSDTLPLVANVSILFTELPYLDRFAAAAACGFQGVESWWPFETAAPEDADIDRFIGAIAASGIPLVGLNLFGGDLTRGDRGVLSHPDRQPEFDHNLAVVAAIAQRTGCRVFNALYGLRRAGMNTADQDATALMNLSTAAQQLGDLGGTVLVEALSADSVPDYPLRTARDAARIVERTREVAGRDEIGVLFDVYHLASSGEDLESAVQEYRALIAHVQLADSPGRGEPGSGRLPFPDLLEGLWRSGYRGAVAAEYSPTTRTEASLGWVEHMPRVRLRPVRVTTAEECST